MRLILFKIKFIWSFLFHWHCYGYDQEDGYHFFYDIKTEESWGKSQKDL